MSELGSTASFGSVAAPRLIAPLAGYRFGVLFPSCFARSNAIRILHLSLKHGLGSRPKVADASLFRGRPRGTHAI